MKKLDKIIEISRNSDIYKKIVADNDKWYKSKVSFGGDNKEFNLALEKQAKENSIKNTLNQYNLKLID